MSCEAWLEKTLPTFCEGCKQLGDDGRATPFMRKGACVNFNFSVSALLTVVLADYPDDEKLGIDGDLWHTSYKGQECVFLTHVVLGSCCAWVSVGVVGTGTVHLCGL